jgi:hypothetical protein
MTFRPPHSYSFALASRSPRALNPEANGCCRWLTKVCMQLNTTCALHRLRLRGLGPTKASRCRAIGWRKQKRCRRAKGNKLQSLRATGPQGPPGKDQDVCTAKGRRSAVMVAHAQGEGSSLTEADTPSFPRQHGGDTLGDEGGGEASIGVVFGIIDRDWDGRIFRYRVQWRDEPDGHRWPDSWEPGNCLRDDGFDDACSIVDEWKASSIQCFYTFCKLNGHASRIGASPRKDCAVYGIRVAAELIGSGDWCPGDVVKEFRDQCASRGRPFSDEGISYGELRCLIRFANERCSESAQRLSLPILDKSIMSGVNGCTAGRRLLELPMPCGVYLCAAFDSKRCTHCFVINAEDTTKRVYDVKHDGVFISKYDTTWIYGVMFVRRVERYAGKRA